LPEPPDGLAVWTPLAGGTPTTLATGQISAGAIAVDSTSAYWTNYGSGYVMKMTPK